MAILNGGLLGTSRNKVGGIVSYRLRGQTVAREYVQTINNPRSAAQMVQRAKLINLVAAYRANQFWMNSGAFESKKATWSDYNAFVSANTLLNPVYMTRPMVAAGAGIVQAYQVTRGSLPTIQTTWNVSDTAYITDLSVGTEAPETIAQLSAALLANNNGIRERDQLSFILNYQRIGNNGYPYILARAYELIIDSTDTRNILDVVPNMQFDTGGTGNINYLEFNPVTEADLAGAAIIISRDSGGQIAVSNQSLVLTPAMTQYILQWQNSSAYAAYAASYGEGDTNFLAGGYSTIGSNGGVPLTLQITSIATPSSGEIPVGQVGITINTGNSYYLYLSGEATGTTALRIEAKGSEGDLPVINTLTERLTISANSVSFPGSELTNANGLTITKVVATINGQSIEAAWRAPEAGGDVG